MANTGFHDRRGLSLADRLMLHVVMIPESTCWHWDGHHDRDGYAKTSIRDIPTGAHRAAYEAFVGPIPEGMVIDHVCRNRGCVNPRHLEVVTSRENTMRSPIAAAAVNGRMTHCPRGHELTPDNLVQNIGKRRCLTCAKEVGRQRYLAMKAAGIRKRRTKCRYGHPFTAAVASGKHRKCANCAKGG